MNLLKVYSSYLNKFVRTFNFDHERMKIKRFKKNLPLDKDQSTKSVENLHEIYYAMFSHH